MGHNSIGPYSNLSLIYFHELDSSDSDKFVFFDDKNIENAIGLSDTFGNSDLSNDTLIPNIKQGDVLIFPSLLTNMILKLNKSAVIFHANYQIVPKFITSGKYFLRNENPVIIIDGERV